MPNDDATCCPGCGHGMTRVADHGIRFECACGGRMLGVVPFEHRLEEGLGARLYVASTNGDLAGSCPFCQRAMRHVSDGTGPSGLAFCHLCEQVWLPPDTADWLASHQSGSSRPEAPRPSRCEDCGAPWAPDNFGRCPYCHAQLTAPDPVIVAL